MKRNWMKQITMPKWIYANSIYQKYITFFYVTVQ